MGIDEAARRPASLTRPDVSVAIVSYNTRDDLCRCLSTIRDSGTKCALEILVVDNASGDGTPDAVEKDYPEVHLVRNAENVGYSRAVNQAIHAASGRFILIINPDIEVLPGSIDALLAHMHHSPKTGIAGSKLLNPDGSLQYSCRTFYTLSTLLYRRTPLGKIFPQSRVVRDHLMIDWDHDTDREVDWMLGACLMVRTEAIREVGLMDERFFMYFEDVDWCYRMKQHGWGVMYVPGAVMMHVHRRESAAGGGFGNRRLRAHLNSMFRFFDKWNVLLYRIRKHRDATLGATLFAWDVLAVNLAFLGAFEIRTLLREQLRRPVFPIEAYGAFLLLLIAVVLFVNAMQGLYRHPTSRDLFDDAVDLAKGLLFSILVLMASTFLTRSELHSRFMVAVFAPLAFAVMLAGRGGISAVAQKLRRSRFDLTRAVVLGEREAARSFARELESRPVLGYEVVAALADRPGEEERRFRELWDAEGIRELVQRHRVAEVLLVRPTISDREVARLVLLCKRDGVGVRLVSGVADVLPAGLSVSTLLGRPAVDLSSAGGRGALGLGLAIKHGIDRIAGAMGLLFLRPFAFAREMRAVEAKETHDVVHGERGRVFRTRALGDGRLPLAAALGHLLRGEMSLVGPRPRRAEEVAADEELRVLFDLARPGVTGSWRAFAPLELRREEEISLALSALQNQSLLGDLKILLKTLKRPRSTPMASRRNP